MTVNYHRVSALAVAGPPGPDSDLRDVTDPIRRLISERVTVDDRYVADPDVPADRLASAAGGVA